MHVRGDVVFETGIAIGTEAHLLAIDVDGGIHVDTVELEIIVYSGFVNSKRFPVPANAAREGTTASTAGVTYVEVTLDSPIMGHVEQPPPGVVIVCIRHLDGVA